MSKFNETLDIALFPRIDFVVFLLNIQYFLFQRL